MPTYDYVCRKCEHRFEQYQSMTEAVLRKCPACGKLALERLIGAGAGILFKGSGFYETDYKRAASKPETPAAPASSDKPAAGGATTPRPATDKPASPAPASPAPSSRSSAPGKPGPGPSDKGSAKSD
jgi:putative FmdB family regulatory protein